MNKLITFSQIILVGFAVQCDSRSSSTKGSLYDCNSYSQEHITSDCTTNNEVSNSMQRDAESSIDRADIQININKHNVNICDGKEDADTKDTTTDTVADSATIKNTACGYQNNISMEEDESKTKSAIVDYPFSVSIQRKGAHYVSGALIDKRWILSVAGEFYHVRESLKLFKARLGSVDCKRGGSLIPIKRIETHPNYIYGQPNFDIALLRMAVPVVYSELIRPIGISNINGKVLSAKFMTTYWPRIVLNGNTIPEKAKERVKYNSMRVSTQRLIPTDKCKRIMSYIKEDITESSLCLKPVVTHHSVCMPDAGAPVVAEDGLWGITSGWISPTCPSFEAPTIFTRLSSSFVRSWLNTHLL